MTETERAAWTAFEAGIVEDAMAAGLIDDVAKQLRRIQAERAIQEYAKQPMKVVQGATNRETPYRCPNCEGVGKRSYPPPPNYAGTTAMFGLPQECHSCQGKGVVWR